MQHFNFIVKQASEVFWKMSPYKWTKANLRNLYEMQLDQALLCIGTMCLIGRRHLECRVGLHLQRW